LLAWSDARTDVPDSPDLHDREAPGHAHILNRSILTLPLEDISRKESNLIPKKSAFSAAFSRVTRRNRHPESFTNPAFQIPVLKVKPNNEGIVSFVEKKTAINIALANTSAEIEPNQRTAVEKRTKIGSIEQHSQDVQ